jgi:hypothetical protein
MVNTVIDGSPLHAASPTRSVEQSEQHVVGVRAEGDGDDRDAGERMTGG